MKNRIISLVIAVCVLSSCLMAVPAYAAEKQNYSRAAMFLTGLNIMEDDPDTGMFWDDCIVKRFEIAQILCNLFGYEAKVGSERIFDDVSEDDRAYVETVVRNGLMSGYSEGNFGPDDYVTYEQILKVFVEIIGGKDYAKMLGGFPSGYLTAAKRLGIGTGLSLAATDAVRRIDVANIIYDTMHIDMIQLKGIQGDYASYGIVEGRTLLSELLDVEIEEGIVTAIDSTKINDKNLGTGEAQVVVDGVLIDDPDGIADEYLGCSVRAYVKMKKGFDRGTLIYVEEAYSNNVIEIEGENIISASLNNISYYDQNGKSRDAKVSVGTDMVLNGKAVKIKDEISRVKKSYDIAVKLVDNDGDNTFDFINVLEYNHYAVTSVDTENEKIYLSYGKGSLELKDNFARVFYNGEKCRLEDIEAGMVLSVATSDEEKGKAIRIEATDDNVLGSVETVTQKGDSDYVSIQGELYRISDEAKALARSGKIPEIILGLSGQFYLNVKGDIVCVEKNSASGSIGYMIDMGYEDGTFGEKTLFVKLFTEAAKIEILTATERIKINNGEAVKTYKIKDFAGSADYNDVVTNTVDKQLVLYEANEGIIKSLTYCKNLEAYNADEFSLDKDYVDNPISASRTGVYDDKYSIDNATKVFVVPHASYPSQELDRYSIRNGSYLTKTESYRMRMYDISPTGYVNYALVRKGEYYLATTSNRMLITEIMQGIDENGDSVTILEGWVQNNTKVNVTFKEVINSSGKTVSLNKGDVVECAKNALNYGCMVRYFKKVTSEDTGINIEGKHGENTYAYGYAANVTADKFIISKAKGENQDPTSTDALITVPNTGAAVFIFYKDSQKAEQATFTDILEGDKVFAHINTSNQLQMMVIYR